MKALLIFIKNPIEGKVKTRLAASIGNKKALEIYLKLQDHTRKISQKYDIDRLLFYSDYIDNNDLWPNEKFQKKLQNQTNDLGFKMYEAFLMALQENYQKLFIIGSDCYELNSEMIAKAYDSLEKQTAVLGPANDGGYYGLGINFSQINNNEALLSELFLDKDWSHDQVYKQAVKVFQKHNIDFSVLPILKDLDTIEDLEKFPDLRF
jgi:uncharacterized protein